MRGQGAAASFAWTTPNNNSKELAGSALIGA